MRWLGIGIVLGVGIMLAPYLVSAIWAVVSLLFWLSAGGIYLFIKGIENDTISVWWIVAPVLVAGFIASCYCWEEHK